MVNSRRAGKFIKPSGLVCTILVICFFPVMSLSAAYYDGTRVAPFLYVPVGARLTVFPSVISSAHPDASLIFSNPASLALVEGKQLFVTSSNWLDNVSYSAGGLVWPLMGTGFKSGIGARLMYSGGLKGYSNNMQVVREESYYDVALTASLSREIPVLDLAASASVTYVRENLGDISGNGFSFSAGLYKNLSGNIFTFFLKNVGGRLSFPDGSFDLDASGGFGYARGIMRSWGALVLGGELEFFKSGARELSFGADYLLNRVLSLRLGTLHSLTSVENSRYPLSAGLGIRMAGATIDYAFTPRDYFSNTHTFSFSFSFSKGRNTGEVNPKKAKRPDNEYSVESSDRSSAVEYSSELIRRELDQGGMSRKSKERNSGSLASDKVMNFIVAGGRHKNKLGAENEIHALRAEDIPAVIRRIGNTYVVTIGNFSDKGEAEKLVKYYRGKGYSFSVLSINN